MSELVKTPSKPGVYNVAFDGIMTLMPLSAYFDGEKWYKSPSCALLLEDDPLFGGRPFEFFE